MKKVLFTDKSTLYVDKANFMELHITEKSTKESNNQTLKWAHIFISNVKKIN
jgi:hypothetical protein